MKISARYAKVVEWSEEDGCYVGSAPGLILGGCHGDNERHDFEELCQIVAETIDLYRQDGKPLPPPTSGQDLANRRATRKLGIALDQAHQVPCSIPNI